MTYILPPHSFMDATHSENTKRIAKNTLVLYVRMLFSMLVSLYTSRVILNTLGVEDYGIQNVVGGVVGMFSLISNSLCASTGRFLTFELGRGDMNRLKLVFSTSLVIHVALAVIIFVATETLGLWFLNTQVVLPANRLVAANWVFQTSVLSFMLGLFSVPFNASIVSHERMSAFAYFGIFDVLARLLIILFVAYAPWQFDKLIVYALLLLTLSVTMQGIYLSYCRRHFEECRLRFLFDRSYWKEMSGFAIWNFIGCTAGLLKDQGVNLLLNLYAGGPVINAARGVALSVNNAVGGFAGNFMTALNPQITKSYAADDRDYMLSIVERGSRFSFYILLILALPILFETDFVLTLWLKHYPAHSVSFVRLVLLLTMSDILSNTLITLQSATGKIRNYQIVVGGMLLMNFPLSWICLKLGYAPEYVYYVGLGVSFACMMLRLWFLRRMAGLSMRRFLRNVYLNVWIVSVAAAILPFALLRTLPLEGWQRFLMLSVVCVVCSIFSVWRLGCTQGERRFLVAKAKETMHRFL